MIFQNNKSQTISSPLMLCIVTFCSLIIFHKSMDLMLMNNYVNDEYSKLSYEKRSLNNERKSLEVYIDKIYLSDATNLDSNLEISDVKKIELINKLKDWSST